MTPKFFILCKSSSIDQSSNSLSIFELVHQLKIRQELDEVINFRVQTLALFLRDEDDGEGILEKNVNLFIENPNGESQQVGENLPIRFEENHKRFRLRVNLDIPIKDPGIYTLKLSEVDTELEVDTKLIVNLGD